MANHDDTQEQLNDLEEEEARIMRELRDLEERARADEEAKQRHQQTLRNDPESALATLLLECEKEVRDAKGYIANHGPPLTIVRVRVGETAPKGATYLSRPKNTGVDFTVPLTTKEYTSVIKRPMFLNTIRDKIKAHAYTSSDDYVDDMRLMARNTATFNKGPELAWVVQHARLLLEAAEDAVTARQKQFYVAEDALRQASTQKNRAIAGGSSATGKRKRTSQGVSAVDTANGETKLPSVGQAIEVYWPNYRRWFTASVVGKSGSNVHVIYEEDNTDQWIDLQSNMRWRVRNTRAAASTKSRRTQEPPSIKRRKGATSSAGPLGSGAGAAYIPPGLVNEDTEAVRSELSSKFEELKLSVEDLIKEHMDRIDRMLLRSDHLDRVLLAVEDSRENMESFMERIEERQSRLENNLDRFTQQGLKTPRRDSGDRSPSEDTPPPVEKSIEEAPEAENQEMKATEKTLASKQSHADEVAEVVFVPVHEPVEVQSGEKEVELADSGRENERNGVGMGQEIEGDEKNRISVERDGEVQLADDRGVERDVIETSAANLVREVRNPVSTNENMETTSVEEGDPAIAAVGIEKEQTHERQSDATGQSEEPKVLKATVDEVGSGSKKDDDGKSREMPPEESEQNNGTIEAPIAVKQEMINEGLRGAIVIDGGSSEGSDESGDSDGSGNGKNSDADERKNLRKNADDVKENDSGKLRPESEAIEDHNSSGNGGNKDDEDSGKELRKSNNSSGNGEDKMTEATMKEKKAGNIVSIEVNSDKSEDDMKKMNANKSDG